jgi:hypothetical protein
MFPCIVSQREIEFEPKAQNPRPSFRQETCRTIHGNPNGRACLCQAGRLAPTHHERKETDDPNTFRTRSGRTPRLTLPSQPLRFLRLSTTHGPKVRAIVPLALRCRDISQGLIGMESMPLRLLPTSHIFSVGHGVGAGLGSVATTYEARKGRAEYGREFPTGIQEYARHTLTISRSQPHTNTFLVLSRGRIMTGRKQGRVPAECKCNREEK